MTDIDLTSLAHGQMPFTGILGLEIESGGPERVEGRGQWRAEYCTAAGLIHGGYLMALADSVGAMCAFFNLPEGATTSTIESKTNFFRPV
ncbi:MAG: PaaI family thioesterase, partial [Actinobacteria bacterium]|nr:PaaI family thioesterase [Actinomycetota bacterium]